MHNYNSTKNNVKKRRNYKFLCLCFRDKSAVILRLKRAPWSPWLLGALLMAVSLALERDPECAFLTLCPSQCCCSKDCTWRRTGVAKAQMREPQGEDFWLHPPCPRGARSARMVLGTLGGSPATLQGRTHCCLFSIRLTLLKMQNHG